MEPDVYQVLDIHLEGVEGVEWAELGWVLFWMYGEFKVKVQGGLASPISCGWGLIPTNRSNTTVSHEY